MPEGGTVSVNQACDIGLEDRETQKTVFPPNGALKVNKEQKLTDPRSSRAGNDSKVQLQQGDEKPAVSRKPKGQPEKHSQPADPTVRRTTGVSGETQLNDRTTPSARTEVFETLPPARLYFCNKEHQKQHHTADIDSPTDSFPKQPKAQLPGQIWLACLYSSLKAKNAFHVL